MNRIKDPSPNGPSLVQAQREFALLKVYCLMEISNNKSQKTNKYQHAAQAPALRVTEFQNSKQKNNRFEPVWKLEFVIYL
jgi:hypothetical protein